jgi:hypothetical protein
MSVAVTNAGVVALPIASITLSSSSPQPYSQTNTCGSSVAVGGSCMISVVFDPGTPGASPATLAINAGTSASNVSLSGTGTFQISLTTSAQTVTAGAPVTLTWSSPANASCTASGGNSGDAWSGALAASGSQSVTESAAGSYSYGLTCSSLGTSASATVAVTVTAAPAPAMPDVTLTASPASVNVGQKVTLSWSSQNAAICVGSGGPSGDGWSASQSLDGSTTVSLASSGMVAFTLTCSAGARSMVATATVMVANSSGGGGGGAFGGMELLLLSTVAMRAVRQRKAGVITLH